MRYGAGGAGRNVVAVVAAAVGLIVVLGCAGRVIDVVTWKIAVQRMRTVADEAAHAASIAAAAGEDPALVARRTIAQAGLVAGKAGLTVEVNRPPTQGRYAGSDTAIEIVISRVQPMYFTNLFLRLSPTVSQSTASARAVAPLRWQRE